MARIHFTDANAGLYRYDEFEDFAVTELSGSRVVLAYDEGLAGSPFDPSISPARIEISVRSGKLGTLENGPNAGETVFVEGSVSQVVAEDASGAALLGISDIAMEAGLPSLMLVEDRARRLYDQFVAGGSTFEDNGSADNGSNVATGVGDDVVKAKGGGFVYIQDTGGADRYVGHRQSYDIVTHDQWWWGSQVIDRGVRVDLSKKRALGPDGERDVLKKIEEVRGTYLDDDFEGDGKDDTFYGLRGDDRFDGGGGFDRISYRRDHDQGGHDGIQADLKRGFVIDGYGDRDAISRKRKVASVESVQGTEQDDRFADDRGGNLFDETGGDDRLVFGRGDDVGVGGGGADLFRYVGRAFGGNVIRDFDAGEGDVVEIAAANAVSDLRVRSDAEGTPVRPKGSGSTVHLEGVDAVAPEDFGFRAGSHRGPTGVS